MSYGAVRVLVHRHRHEFGPVVMRLGQGRGPRRLFSARDLRALRSAIRVRIRDVL